MSLDELFPSVNLPTQSGIGYKIVLLEIKGKHYLRFAKTNSTDEHHPILLRNTLEEFKLNYDEVTRSDDIIIPRHFGEKYKAIAMGKADINLDMITAEFHGSSANYPLSIYNKHLILIQPILPGWNLIHSIG